MVDADAAVEHLLDLRADPLRPVELADLRVQGGLLPFLQQRQPLELLGHIPALVAIEAKNEGRHLAGMAVALGHQHDLLGEELVGDPHVGERHLALLALDQLEPPAMAALEPGQEFARIADGRGQKQQPGVRRQQGERQFPDDPAFEIGEAVELVHDDGRDVVEVEGVGMEQAVEQDLGDDDEHARVRIDAAIAGDQAHVLGPEAPADGVFLHLAEFLFGQRDERRRVIGRGGGVQRLVQRRLSDERLAGASRGADQHAAFGGEPRQERVLLHGVGRVRQLGEIFFGKLVARGIAHAVPCGVGTEEGVNRIKLS